MMRTAVVALAFGGAILFARTTTADAVTPPSSISSRHALRPGGRMTQNSGNIDLWNCIPNADGDFTIEILNMGKSDIDESLTGAFELAAKRWEKVIVGDVTPSFAAGSTDDWFNGQFAAPYNGAVDDVVIGFEIADIDGPGGTLGAAGPIFVRTTDQGAPLSPISGVMIFDLADVMQMPVDDFKAVVLHEMGHILGKKQ